jgi:hypothetical protein
MDKNVFLDKIREFKRVMEEHKIMMKENAKNVFSEISKDIFTNNPQLNSFSWNQYTPYFNDGDTCYFSVNRDYYKINESSDNIDSWTLNNEKYSKDLDLVELGFDSLESLKKAYNDIDELMNIFDDSDLEEMFDDHVEITVYRDGRIEVDDYSHD